jgi:hypothetical protein
VHADERRRHRVDRATHQREVHVAMHVILVSEQTEIAELRADLLLGDALDRTLLPQPMTNEVRDRADLEPVAHGESLEIRPARHGAVVVHDLDDHRRGIESRETRKIAARLRVARARQHATGLRHHGKDVPGLAQVFRARIRLDRGEHGVCAIVRGDPGGHTLRRLDREREVGAMFAVRLAHHERQAQLLATLGREREADEPAAEARHEVDVLRAHLLRGHHEIAFVLAILVVHDDDHAARGDVGEDVFDVVQWVHAGSDDRRST